MDQDTAKKILESVKGAYAKIAPEFDYTRKDLWPGLKQFSRYIKDGDTILDAGCGNGRLSLLVGEKRAEYVGMDNNIELVKIARKNFPERAFVLGDLLNMPFGENEFDVVFCIASFHHLPDKKSRRKALSEMRRVMKTGAVLIMTNWDFFHGKYLQYVYKNILLKIIGKSKLGFRDAMIPWGGGHQRYYHLFSRRELKNLFQAENFIVEKIYIARYSREKNLVIIAKK